MNINFHYYLVKALAIEAGLTEGEAQILALTSQMVDDVTPDFFRGEQFATKKGNMLKIYVQDEPSDYFKENGMVGEIGDGYYQICPSITSFGLLDARKEFYQLESVIPFHFFVEDYTEDPADRSTLRTKPALPGSFLYDSIDAIIGNMVVIQNQGTGSQLQRTRDLIRVGMLLHVFADTFAHDGFSGSQGWENKAKLIKIFDSGLEERARAGLEHFSDRMGDLTACGHGQISHLPDVCGAAFWYKYMASDGDGYVLNKCRYNRFIFEQCAWYIFEWFMKLAGAQQQAEERWEHIRKRLMDTACLVASEIDDVAHADELAAIWADNYFGDPNMACRLNYNMNYLFDQQEAGDIEGVPIYHFGNRENFYLFNEVTYDLRRCVMGTF